jgi:hypothetical protein
LRVSAFDVVTTVFLRGIICEMGSMAVQCDLPRCPWRRSSKAGYKVFRSMPARFMRTLRNRLREQFLVSPANPHSQTAANRRRENEGLKAMISARGFGCCSPQLSALPATASLPKRARTGQDCYRIGRYGSQPGASCCDG